MAEILLFHHALGLTDGVKAFADEIRVAGHTVHTPDMFDGMTFDELEAGVAHEESIGWEAMVARTQAAADALPADVVYGGFSLGVVYAHRLVETRPGARGGLFFYAAVQAVQFGGWPEGVPAQIHSMEGDEWADVDDAKTFVEAVPTAELFLYPGDAHVFLDSSSSDYDEAAAALATPRILTFLERL